MMHDKCKRCEHRKDLFEQGLNSKLYLSICMSEPYKDSPNLDGSDNVAWLDVSNFNSDMCMNFKERLG